MVVLEKSPHVLKISLENHNYSVTRFVVNVEMGDENCMWICWQHP